MTPARALSLAALLMLPLACKADPAADPGDSQQAKSDAEAKPAKADDAPDAAPADPKALTAEELALIEADPATLTPEQNRKRGYALRKQVMQDPDSPAAKALEEAKQAALAGEVEVPTESVGDPATKSDPKDNGVVIPAPDYLKTPQGEPAN